MATRATLMQGNAGDQTNKRIVKLQNLSQRIPIRVPIRKVSYEKHTYKLQFLIVSCYDRYS